MREKRLDVGGVLRGLLIAALVLLVRVTASEDGQVPAAGVDHDLVRRALLLTSGRGNPRADVGGQLDHDRVVRCGCDHFFRLYDSAPPFEHGQRSP